MLNVKQESCEYHKSFKVPSLLADALIITLKSGGNSMFNIVNKFWFWYTGWWQIFQWDSWKWHLCRLWCSCPDLGLSQFGLFNVYWVFGYTSQFGDTYIQSSLPWWVWHEIMELLHVCDVASSDVARPLSYKTKTTYFSRPRSLFSKPSNY